MVGGKLGRLACLSDEDPACAEVCPADAIKKTADGVVQTALPSHCIGCTNCVLACPFGVPHGLPQLDLMMKCDMCYDRTSAGSGPCASRSAPVGALAYGTRAEIEALRRERPINTFVFGPQVVQTKVQMMVPVRRGGTRSRYHGVYDVRTGDDCTTHAPCLGHQRNGKGASAPEVPTWKDHFPDSWVDDHFVTRREFTKSLVWVSLATFLANVVLAMLSRLKRLWGAEALPQVQIATVHDLPVGGARVFHYPASGDPCLLVRLDVDRYVAFGQKCTHLGCPVSYRAADRQLYCPCHQGFFDAADGRVLAGPPSRPLPRVTLERRGEELWAIGKV